MAGLSWYRAGTVAVTNGSKSVTGVDTLWQGVINLGDALQAPDGKWYEVETVSSNAALTLKTAYAGATAAAQAYAIMRIVPTGNVAADLVAGLTALMQRYNVSMDQLLGLLDSSNDVSFSDGTTTLTGLAGLRKLAAVATESAAGRVELATAAETAVGTDGSRAVHPAGLKPLLDAKAPLAAPAFSGNATAVALAVSGAFSAAQGVSVGLPGVSGTASIQLCPKEAGGSIAQLQNRSGYLGLGFGASGDAATSRLMVTPAGSVSIGAVPGADIPARMAITRVADAFDGIPRHLMLCNEVGYGSAQAGIRLLGNRSVNDPVLPFSIADIVMSSGSSPALIVRLGNTSARNLAVPEVARFTASGSLLLGTVTPSGADMLQVAGTIAADAFRAKSYTKATVPSVSAYVRSTIYVSDAAGGASLAWSDGTSWISFKTNAAI